MSIENEVVSLELAKKLLAIGVKQESYFWYTCFKDGTADIYYQYDKKYIPPSYCSAFTTGELMELLPAFIDTGKDEPFNIFWLSIKKRSAKNIQYIARYVCDSIPGEQIDNPFYEIKHSYFKAHAEKLSDCLALMLISLIEDR